MSLTYEQRTPESIRAELDAITPDGVLKLARFLEDWMANEHNGRDFVHACCEMLKVGIKPCDVAEQLLAHAHDWFAYGN